MKHINILVSLIIILIVSIVAFNGYFDELENGMQDRVFQTKHSHADLENIVVIGIDDESLKMLGRWPWDRSAHAEIIRKVTEGKAAAIGFDIILSENSESIESDNDLVSASKAAGNVIFPIVGEFDVKTLSAKPGFWKTTSSVEANELIESFDALKKVSTGGHINVFEDAKDGIIRQALDSFKYNGKEIKSFDYEIVKKYEEKTGKKVIKNEIPVDFFNRYYIDFNGDPGAFKPISYYDVLSGSVPVEYFKDKIVLIGPYAAGFENDSFYTSIQKNVLMYGVEVHANIIQNIIHNNFKKNVSNLINTLIIFLMGLIGHIIFKRVMPKISFFLLVGIISAYVYISFFIYSKGYIVNIVYPLMALGSIYISSIVYRYLVELEEKRRITNIFGKYVEPQVVTEILKGGIEGIELGGLKKEISVLFVDIRGFTPLSEKVEPEQVVEILNEYLTLTTNSIFKYGGTLDKFIGDAAMAIFNAPLDLQHHPYKAVQTAFSMKESSYELKKKLQERFGVSVEFGIGINTGYAIVGNIGSKTRMDYTAIGDTVNTAARLESNAKAGQILISESTYEKVKDKVRVEHLGKIKVKGKEQELDVFELKEVYEM